MPLSAGIRLGPYEIVAPIGAGGMGEVYRARDTRLDRLVAVKVLSPQLSATAELRSRFEREARVISSLQHPHICTLYDVGREGDTDYLVMELLEGESLAQRLSKGPLPIDEVLRLGIQIADALEKAHGAGIVHRDLKPGNVFVTDRCVKLLDFGLAKLHGTAPQLTGTALSRKATEATPDSLTGEGVILGTFRYMAPEQLEGKEADPRTDIFALGTVLYEMATGKRAFTGDSQASLIGAIMQSKPAAVSSLAPVSPPALDRVISTCMAKDPRDRWQSAHDVRLQLAWIAEGGSQAGLAAPVAPRRAGRERLVWGGIALVSLAVAIVAAIYAMRAPVAGELATFQVQAPARNTIVGIPTLSPDGRFLAFLATDEQGLTRVWVRPIGALEERPLPGTEVSGEGHFWVLFWSPDSRFVCYHGHDHGQDQDVATANFMKVEVSGGVPHQICGSPGGGSATWGDDGSILMGGPGAVATVRRVSAEGGDPTVVKGIKGQLDWLQLLPGGKRLLYQDCTANAGIGIANADGSNMREVLRDVSHAEYAPPGYLFFVRNSTLFAQRFDAASVGLAGKPVFIADGVETGPWGWASFSVSRAGVLAYRTAPKTLSLQFIWLDREGKRSVALASNTGGNFALSPDGRWLATERYGENGNVDLWLHDLKRGVSSRFTAEPGITQNPVFTPDGREVAFARRDSSNHPWKLVARALDRSGGERLLYEDKKLNFLAPETFTPDGKTLLFNRTKGVEGWLGLVAPPFEIWRLEVGRPDSATPLVVSDSGASRPAISPDGRWLAYQSKESGRDEVYVTGQSGSGARWQISTLGGQEAEWGPDGKELFFLSPERELMRVAVQTSPSFDASDAKPLPFGTAPVFGPMARNRYLVAPDGKRFLVLSRPAEQEAAPVTIVLNWQRLLRR